MCMRGSWYKLGDRIVCIDCARHIAGNLIKGQGPSPEPCSICGGRKLPKPHSRYDQISADEHRHKQRNR